MFQPLAKCAETVSKEKLLVGFKDSFSFGGHTAKQHEGKLPPYIYPRCVHARTSPIIRPRSYRRPAQRNIPILIPRSLPQSDAQAAELSFRSLLVSRVRRMCPWPLPCSGVLGARKALGGVGGWLGDFKRVPGAREALGRFRFQNGHKPRVAPRPAVYCRHTNAFRAQPTS